jgi:hypothetical protein
MGVRTITFFRGDGDRMVTMPQKNPIERRKNSEWRKIGLQWRLPVGSIEVFIGTRG